MWPISGREGGFVAEASARHPDAPRQKGSEPECGTEFHTPATFADWAFVPAAHGDTHGRWSWSQEGMPPPSASNGRACGAFECNCVIAKMT